MKKIKKTIITLFLITSLFVIYPNTKETNVEAAANFWNNKSETTNACRYLIQNLGFSKYAASGILGNFQNESNVNPYVRERIGDHNTYSLGKEKADMLDPDNNGFGPGWGLAQWGDGSGAGGAGSRRWLNLLKFVNKKYGTNFSASFQDSYRWNIDNEKSLRENIPSLYQQLDFVKEEMKPGTSYVTQAELNQMSTIDEVSDAVLYRYEIAGTKTSARRIGYAKDIYLNNCSQIEGVDSYAKKFVSEGSIELISEEKNYLNIKGWHASSEATTSSKRYMFLMDAATDEELYRLPVISEDRQDIGIRFPSFSNSKKSGFNVKIPINPKFKGKKVYVVSRYLPADNPNQTVSDIWFTNKKFDISNNPTVSENLGYLDSIKISDNDIDVKGWHASTDATSEAKRYISVIDTETAVELEKFPLISEKRLDVLSIYPQATTAGESGFHNVIPITDKMRGKTIYVKTSYVNKEGQAIDYYFKNSATLIPKKTQVELAGDINDFKEEDNSMYIRGWHATTKATSQSERYLFLLESGTNKEYKRIKITDINRPDVKQAYPMIETASTSGFEMKIPITKEMQGKKFYVVSRYMPGNDPNQSVSDIYFDNRVLTVSKPLDVYADGDINDFKEEDNSIYIRGWHTTTRGTSQSERYLFLLESGTNKEYKRIKITNINRPDVKQAYPMIETASTSGFEMKIPITKEMQGKKFYVVSRYMPGNDPNQSVSDIYFDNRILTVSKPLDIYADGDINDFKEEDNSIYIRGWHATTRGTSQSERYLFLLESGTNKEYKRIKITNINRPDVKQAYPMIETASTSGFEMKIPITNEMRGKKFYIVTRYMPGSDANQSVSDIYFTEKTIKV